MEDGFPTPKAMDGMAAFAAPNGNILLVRNHEDGQAGNTLRPRPPGSTSTQRGHSRRPARDALRPAGVRLRHICGGRHHHAGGGAARPAPRSCGQHWSLVGTVRNCAGGLTPWGSWLSCEETLESASATGYAQDHGYIFEVPIDTVPGHAGAARRRCGISAASRTKPSPSIRRPAPCTRRKTRVTDRASTGSCPSRAAAASRRSRRRPPACCRC